MQKAPGSDYGYERIAAFLVSMPMAGDHGDWRYSVTARPKAERTIVPTPTPQPTAPPDEPNLPQTGLLLWPVLAMAAACFLLYENHREEAAAGTESAVVLTQLREALAEDAQAGVTAVPGHDETQTDAPRDMPTLEIDGQAYIGYLELLTLPVMSDWSYEKLRIAPCRYWGSVYDDSLVILAHNYARHFGGIKDLEIGDSVQFIAADGVIYRYAVAAQETLERGDVAAMTGSDYDLTLFTCTYGGRRRVTVRLNRVQTFE